MKNIGWYTRDGHLDFLAKLSSRLKEKGNNICSHYICHSKAEEKNLQDKYNITAWNLGDYLEERKKTFHLSEDIFSELEDKYNLIPLRWLLWSEMHEMRFSEERMIFHLIAHFEFWEKFLSENKIDVMVSERPSILSTSVLWVVCQKLDIRSLDFINIGIDGRIVFSTSWYGDIDGFRDAFETIKIDEDSDTYRKTILYLKKMTSQPEQPEYIFKNLTTGKKITTNKLYQSFPNIPWNENIFELLKRLMKSKEMHLYYIRTNIVQSYLLWFRAYLWLQIYKVINLFEKSKDLPKERYFLFPLHILHEWSDYPWMGLKYPNILYLIKEIAACLPLGCKLYVKEHTTNFPEKSFSFYRSIKKIPQVKLIDRYEDSYKLITNSEGIITLGGTIGLEAMLLGRPVIILAEAWYKHLPGIHKANSPEELVDLLQNIKKLPLANEEDKIKAIYALYQLSFKAERYPVVDLISSENIERYIEPFEFWLRDKVGTGKQMARHQRL